MSSESSNSLDRQSGKNTGLVSLKMGLVEDRKVGWVIVRFPDLGDMLTKWIPVLYTKTQNDKGFWTPDIGEMVMCMMDDRLEDGCVMGAVYSEADQPPTDDMDEYGMQFEDGGWVSYNRATGIAKVVAPTKVILDTPLVHCTGDVQVDGTMTASEDAIGGGVSLKNHIHGGVMVGPSVTTPPVA
jgi:phage baseplate assembly protein gpV